jgi:hypothetical protein
MDCWDFGVPAMRGGQKGIGKTVQTRKREKRGAKVRNEVMSGAG